MRRLLETRQWFVVIGMVALLALCIAALVLTSAPSQSPAAASEKTNLVDQRALQTARALAPLASSPEEQRLSEEALRLADHEVDLAFNDALRDAADHPPQLTPQSRELAQRVSHSEAVLKHDQEQIDSVNKQLTTATDVNRDALQQQLDILRAQQELDQDELDDVKQDLARAGGNPQDRIQRLLDEHEAAQHDAAAKPQQGGPQRQRDSAHLLGALELWNTLQANKLRLSEARNEALHAVADLKQTHDRLEQQGQGETANQQVTSDSAAAIAGLNQDRSVTKQRTAAKLDSLRHLSNKQKHLADLDKRLQDEQELADVYGNWGGLVKLQQRAALHNIVESALWILLILLILYLAGRTIDRLFVELTPERKRLRTLRVVVRFAVQAIGVLIVVFILVGTPSQMPTILGLAGAGLTVALKDFIVAFFGWFVLMGRNGIRVGDWVEINGVGGEVVEIGLLRTVLLETGNWNDAGHPTGRKVAFVNSFAIEGHFFNFSTSGQWLWDELEVLAPANENPYPLIDAIQKLVVEETAANAEAAEEEWRRATSRQRMQSFSAAPAINVRPTSSGIQVVVRYITRAHERYQMRSKLYQSVVELLHGKKATQGASSH